MSGGGALQGLMKFMKDSGYTCSEEWLSACVEWVQENYNPVTEALLRQQAFEQWKDADLVEMESSCLPLNLQNQKVTTLQGKFGLQVNSVQDIGESAYNQWKKIKKLENENTNVAATDSTEVKNSWDPKPLRCLHLNLTDGSQTVYGMELKPLPALSLGLRPGVKILVMGPVECRRGILQLRPQNIKVIGGEVESLAESNSVEAQLRQTLHNPPERDPTPTFAQSGENQSNSQHSNGGSNSNVVSGEFPDDFPDDDGFPAFPEDDDDIFMEIDETELIQSTAAVSANTSTVSVRRNSQSISNAETQRIPSSQLNSSEMRPPASRPINFTQPAKRTLSGTSNSSTDSVISSNSTVSNSTRSRALQPPSKVQKSTAASSSGNAGKSNASRLVVQTKISDFSSDSVGFKSAKSLLPPSKPKPKQLKIDGYMKPMPVIIKPPTPKGNAGKVKSTIRTVPLDESSEDLFESSDAPRPHEDEEEFDQGLMDLIDDSIDSELRRLEEEHAEASTDFVMIDDDPPTSPILPSTSASSTRRPIKAPTGIVKPQTSFTNRDKISDECAQLPVSVSKNPFVYLKQVHEHWDSFLEQDQVVVKVKACIATVVSNIRVEEEAWNLEVSINDGTGSMNCKISPEILNEIIGFTPTQMKNIKATKTPDAKEKIAKGMKALTTTLVHLNAIFEIQLGTDPVLIHIQELSSYHMSALKERLSNV